MGSVGVGQTVVYCAQEVGSSSSSPLMKGHGPL